MTIIPKIPRLPNSVAPRVMRAALQVIPATLVLGLLIDLLCWFVFLFPNPIYPIILGIQGAYIALIIMIFPVTLLSICIIVFRRFFGFWWLLASSIFLFVAFSGFLLAFNATTRGSLITPQISRMYAHYGIIYGSALSVAFWQLLLDNNSSLIPESDRRKSISASRWIVGCLVLAWCFIYGINQEPLIGK